MKDEELFTRVVLENGALEKSLSRNETNFECVKG